MCFDRENNRQITEYPLYLHEDEKGNSEIIGRKGRKVRRVEMGGGMPEGGEPYKQLVTDGEGVAKWEDRLAYEHAQTVTWDGDITSPRYTSYSETKGEYRFLDDIPERIEGLKVIGRCVHKATGETRESETVIDSDTHVSTEGDVTYYSYIHATFDFGGELPVSANLELTINESDKEDWPRGVTGGYKVSVLSGETYIIYIESLEFPPTVHKIDPKYLPEGVGGGAQSNQLVIYNEYEQPRKANMTYAEIVDALYGGNPLYGAIVESVASDSSGVTIYPITGIVHFSSAEIPYIEIRHFGTLDMQESSIYMTEDNAFSGMKPGSGGLS